MTPVDRKILLLKKGKTISGLARLRKSQTRSQASVDVIRKQLSMCINGERKYVALQEFIANELGKPVEQLFPHTRSRAA
jgi:hypothetical protein